MAVGIILMSVSPWVSLVARAADTTGMSDVQTDMTVMNASNHTVTFTTPSGVAEGDNFVITFDSDFGSASITEDDIDVADDGVDLTTAADCTGAEEASVSMAGDAVTVTICAGDGGAIAGGSEVIVEIGTNATSSGIGVNRISNPVTEGTYLITISGTFGDEGVIGVFIVPDGGVGVSGQVGETGGDDGDGGDGDGDNEAPNLFNIECSPSETTLTIQWSTDELSDSEVDYGETASYEIGSESDAATVFSHEIELSGLTPGVTYHFRVASSDTSGNRAVSGDNTCTTLDLTAPLIIDVDVIDITESSATIIWETNEDATCTLEYGLDNTYGTSVSEDSADTSHTEPLSDLSSDTEYHFNITCEDASGNVAETGDLSFTTLADTPPANVTGLACFEGDSELSFSWNMPTEEDIEGVLLNCDTNTTPTAPDEGTNEFSGGPTSENATVNGLTNGTTYFCTVFVYDQGANFSSGSAVSCTPTAAELPPEEIPPEEIPPEEIPPEEIPPEEDEEIPPGEELPPGEGLPETDPGTGLPTEELHVLVARDTIELTPQNGAYEVIPDRIFSVRFSLSSLIGKELESATAELDGSLYLLGLEYEGEVTETGVEGGVVDASGVQAYLVAPDRTGDYPTEITLVFTDGTVQHISLTIRVVDLGYVYTVLEDGSVRRMGSAIVTLLVSEFGAWEVIDLFSYGGQGNPDTTASDGTFAWYVPNDVYRVDAAKAGYEDASSGTFTVDNNIATQTLRLELLPLPLEEIPGVEAPFLEKIGMYLDTLESMLDQLRAIPELQVAFDVALPALVVIALSTLAILAMAFNLLPLLQYLVTSPILFLWRRKRKGWGIVYNAATKIPIDLAIVRLYKMPENRLMMTRVSDKQGRYFFLTQPGEYRIAAVKPGFTFPSQILSGVRDDGTFLDVYHGEPIRVTEKDATIAANIPMDPSATGKQQQPQWLVLQRIMRRLQSTIAILGILLAIFIFVFQPTILTFIGLIFQVILFALVSRLAKPRKPKNWGIVYDEATRRPIANAVVRIFEPKYNKLLETVVTDGSGRYNFLVGPNTYYTTYEKTGFQKLEVRPIDMTDSPEHRDIAIDVSLAPAAKPPESSKG